MITASNYTQLSNEFLDAYMARLSGPACKIFMAISRKTVGWRKEVDAISYSQLISVTGISSRSTITKGIEELIECDLITTTKRPGRTTLYDLNIAASPITVPDQSRNQTATSPVTVHTKETLKETPRKKDSEGEKPSPTHALINYFAESYKDKTDTEAAVNWGAWGKNVTRLISHHSSEDVIMVIDYFFAYKERTDFAFYTFVKKFDTLAPAAINGKAKPVHTVPIIDRKGCPACGNMSVMSGGICMRCGLAVTAFEDEKVVTEHKMLYEEKYG